MKTYRNFVIVLLTSCGFVANAAAEDYDFEVGLTYARGSSDSTIISTLNGAPTPFGVVTASSDSDNVSLTGAWYYSGLSDSIGPKSRAAFLSRASSVEMGYSRRDESGSFEFTGGGFFPPVTGSTNITANTLSVDLRNVWRDSGWYALAGISTAELEASAINNGTPGSSDLSTTAYSLGVGKYLGKATTLDLRVATLDAESLDRTVFELTLSHVGSIGKNWQYGADAAYAKSDADGDGEFYALRGALYPSANFEFGFELSHREVGVDGFDSDVIEVFAGWFVRDNVEVAARYRQDNPDFPSEAEIDSSEFGVGVRVRF